MVCVVIVCVVLAIALAGSTKISVQEQIRDYGAAVVFILLAVWAFYLSSQN
jgi:threonine/homoserine/homoserine lactone efflux protein